MFNAKFDAIYRSKLLPALLKLNRRRKMASVTGLLTRLFQIYFVTVIISLFIGFMQMFPFDEFPGSFSRYMQYFMYTVLSIVILGIVNKQIKVYLGEKFPAALSNHVLVIFLTIVVGAGVGAAGFFIGTRYLGSEMDGWFMLKWGLGIASVFVLIGPYFLIRKVEVNFNSDYQKALFESACPELVNDGTFEPESYMPQNLFEESRLFTYQEIWTYTGSLLIARETEHLNGSRLEVRQREVSQSNGKTETKITDLFRGYMVAVDFNKKFSGETYIFPDTSRKTIGEVYGEYLNNVFHRKQTQLVTLENVEFEKEFAVYSTDPQEARYILSTKLMERIMEFKKYFYQDILISFTNNKMFIAVRNDTDMFAPHLFGSLDDAAYLEKQFNYIKAMLTIPETFDLKTKIWAN